MPVPSSVKEDIPSYVDFLASKVNLADKMWTHYGWAAANAYAQAFEMNRKTLGKVKNALDKQSKRDLDSMTFALSLLTVGVAGGAAGGLARWMYDNRDVQDGLKKTVETIAGRPNALAMKSLSPDRSGDVFSPGGTTPEEYTTKLHEGISYNVALLTGVLDEIKYGDGSGGYKYATDFIKLKTGQQLGFNEIKSLVNSIIDSTFMVDMPPLSVSSDTLLKKARIALWIGWTLMRDDKYWAKAPRTNASEYYGKQPFTNDSINSMDDAFWEQYNWETVRRDLVELGAPENMITAKMIMFDSRSRPGEYSGLFMWGLMFWASGPMAWSLLFDSTLPLNSRGFEQVKKQLSKRVMGPMGWINMP